MGKMQVIYFLKIFLKNSIIGILPNFGVLNQECFKPSKALKNAIVPMKDKHIPIVRVAGNRNKTFESIFSLYKPTVAKTKNPEVNPK